MTQKVAKNIRTMFLSAAQNVGLFVFTAFFVTGTLCMEPMAWYRTQIDLVNQYVVLPWGMALCLLRLERRRNALNDATRRDVQALFALLLWIVVPFVLRFGITFNNVGAWYNHTVVYFGIYAFLSEMDGQEREKTFDLFVLLCGVMTFILSGALLYCEATATTIYAGAQSIGFGLGSKRIIADIETIRNAVNLYSVSRMAQAAGVAALEENEYYMENCQRIISAREYTIKMLREQGFEVLDSLGNFVFAKPTGMGAAALKAQLAERGILVRHWDKPRVKDYLRITIGTMQQMQALDAAIEMIFGRA